LENIGKIPLKDEWRNRWATIKQFILNPVREMAFLQDQVSSF
jgi:microcystin synthetase protein McyJ